MITDKLEAISSQNSFFADPLNSRSLGVALLINIIHIGLIYYKFGLSSATLVVHYNIFYGSDAIQSAKFLYIIPSIALVLLIVNFFMARFFYRKEKLASYFLNFSNIPIQLIFLAISIFIIKINA